MKIPRILTEMHSQSEIIRSSAEETDFERLFQKGIKLKLGHVRV